MQTRQAVASDIPFLADIQIMAVTAPYEESMWHMLLHDLPTTEHEFVSAVLQNNASNWGNVADMIVLELEGEPAAACAVFKSDTKKHDFRNLHLNAFDVVAESLRWDAKTAKVFIESYEELWGPGNVPFLRPHGDIIIEGVGVLPTARGKGIGKALLQAAFVRAQELGGKTVGLTVVHGNEAARKLYESIGFI